MDKYYSDNSRINIVWPEFSTKKTSRPRQLISDQIYHAIGHIISINNRIEHTIETVIADTLYQVEGISDFLICKQHNASKREIVNIVAKHYSKTDERVENAVATFLKQAAICLEHRNFVAHASLSIHSMPMALVKTSKNSSKIYNRHQPLLQGLREMAQSAEYVHYFGGTIVGLFLSSDKGRELPPAPPQPRKWDQILPEVAGRAASPQPQ